MKNLKAIIFKHFFFFFFFRQAWALVGVIGGGNSSCNESVRDYENHSTGGKALAQKEFLTVDGQKFVVRAYSEWNDGRKAFTPVGREKIHTACGVFSFGFCYNY